MTTKGPILTSNEAKSATLSAKEQDRLFREQVVGKDQLTSEQNMNEAGNGVHILFTPTQGTPLMIGIDGDKFEVPKGLVPEERMASFDTTVKPRVITTHEMPEKGVKCIYIRCEDRKHVDDAFSNVDDTAYKAFLNKNKKNIAEYVIPEGLFNFLQQKYDMPAAFNYFQPKEGEQKVWGAVFGKQINAKEGNKLTDPGFYKNRDEDLKAVNEILKCITRPTNERTIENIFNLKDLSELNAENTIYKAGRPKRTFYSI